MPGCRTPMLGLLSSKAKPNHALYGLQFTCRDEIYKKNFGTRDTTLGYRVITAEPILVCKPVHTPKPQRIHPKPHCWHECGNIGAKIITNTIVGVPYYDYSTRGPKALFYLLRPLD